MSLYHHRQPATDARYEAAFARVFGGLPMAEIVEPRTARVNARVKPNDTHRRTVTPDSMASWMGAHPDANTREAMLVEFTDHEIRDHFAEAKRIYSRTMADA